MMPSSKTDTGTSMDEVRVRFEQWRATRSTKARIPDDLWALAIETARREGVNRAAQELHLDGGKLKRLLMAADSGGGAGQRSPRFVELIATASGQPEECVIEFESSDGSKMRIQWKTAGPPDWTRLLRAWRDADR
jgi:hypothetical protein